MEDQEWEQVAREAVRPLVLTILSETSCSKCGRKGCCEEGLDVFVSYLCQQCFNKEMMGYYRAVSVRAELWQLEGVDVLLAVDPAGVWLMAIDEIDKNNPLLESTVFEGRAPVTTNYEEDMIDEQIGLQLERDWKGGV